MPERLTGWDKDENGVPHAYVVKCFAGDGCPDMDTSKCNFCDDLVSTYDKLAAYEDSGLTPGEVRALAVGICGTGESCSKVAPLEIILQALATAIDGPGASGAIESRLEAIRLAVAEAIDDT
ncbi:hypothetical protein LJC60_08620 [Ruminococcaceae bacterium OttesenSCG-928-D13]|nr:hypothetical protein [Ruminococcaceae bacterium OttesenSCG-928-D13]